MGHLILTRVGDGIISLSVLSTNMLNGVSNSIYTEFNTSQPDFIEFMSWMYTNFESCALKYGYTGSYYYTHLNEFIE